MHRSPFRDVPSRARGVAPLAVLAAAAMLAACASRPEVERERSMFTYSHPPLGRPERVSARLLLDSVATAVRAGDGERLDSLVPNPSARRWTAANRALFAAFDSAQLDRGYWLRRGGDTAWVHYTVRHNSCTWNVGAERDTPVFVLVRRARSWRLVQAWNPSCED